MGRSRMAGSMATVVAFLAIACACAAAEPPATVPTSRPAAGASQGYDPASWPQLGGPNRDGIAPLTPKLLDSWPKDGPPLLWKSDFIPAFRDGGCCIPVVADGKVFVYANKQPIDGGTSFKFVTAEVLADWGWLPDIPEDLAKTLEEAWASKDRPSSAGWPWWDKERSKKDDLDAFLAKKPELDKYIKDFIAALDPQNAKKYGDHIRRRLCIAAPEKKWGIPDGLTWDELVKLSKLKDEGHGSSGDWAAVLGKVSFKFSISHHISMSPCFEALWRPSFTWSDSVYCLDAATGTELWKKSFAVDKEVLKSPMFNGHPVQWWVFDGLGASATPTIWGGKCYVVGSMGLYCLSAKDGSLLWQVKGGPEHASPLVANGIVYHLGCAYDAETGKLLWKSPAWALADGKHSRFEWVARYNSPILWAAGGPASPEGSAAAGKTYVITTDGRDENGISQVCLDLETGKLIWSVKTGNPGGIYDDILVAGMTLNVPLVQAFKISPAGAELLWKGRFGGGGPVHQGHMYMGTMCGDLKTGEVNWKVGKAACSAHILADGKVFGSLDSSGYSETVPVGMFKATPDKYVTLGSFHPEAITLCPVALAGGKLYVRTKDRIACYDVEEHGVYLDGVTATKDTLTFRFKQTGGGLTAKADGSLKDIQITDAAGVARSAQARIDGDNIVVDVKDAAVPFSVSLAGTNPLAGKNGPPVPAFTWNEARVLKYRKAMDQTVFLKSDIPLQQVGIWNKAETFAVAGAKVTKVELDPQGKGVILTTDKAWKIGDALTLTYPCFAVDQGEARRETLTAAVAEIQRAAARFVKADTTTSGDWKGKYGAEGAMVAGDRGTTEAPKCAIVGLRNQQDAVPWAADAKDPTKPQLTGNSQGRSITHWNAGDEILIDTEITDGKEHQVALYLPLVQRVLSVEVLDADTKAVLDTQTIKPVKGAAGNTYLVWNLKGTVTLQVSNTESAEGNPVWISAVFFDPPAAATQPAK